MPMVVSHSELTVLTHISTRYEYFQASATVVLFHTPQHISRMLRLYSEAENTEENYYLSQVLKCSAF